MSDLVANQSLLPRLSRIEYFRYRDDDLACTVAGAIAAHIDQFPEGVLTEHHAAISAWAQALVDVPNGGFTQFFYNRHGDHGVQALTTLLDRLALPQAATILRDSVAIYHQHQDKFNLSNPREGLFGCIHDFEKLERAFLKTILRCGRAIDAWVREHLAELVTDETGTPIDPKFSGIVEIRFPNGQIRESMEIKKGKAHGAYREYFEDGSPRDARFFQSGKLTADFWPTGQVKRKESKQGKNKIIEWFYRSNALQKRYVVDKDGWAAEPIHLFHENGQLAEEVSKAEHQRCGRWVKFFDDGTPELEAEYVADEELIVHNAWNKNREQIVKDGCGVFCTYQEEIDCQYDLFFNSDHRWEGEVRHGVWHGKVTCFSYGVLDSVSSYVNGKLDGECTSYWDNGRIQFLSKYVDGKEVETKEFPRFDHPVPTVVITVEANERLYRAWKHLEVDTYPHPLNLDEIQQQLAPPQFLQEVYERNLAGTLRDEYEDWNQFKDKIFYFLKVDESGTVVNVRTAGGGEYSAGERHTYLPFLQQLRFAPGYVGHRAVPCQVFAEVIHQFAERADT